MTESKLIANRDRAKQLLAFDDLCFGKNKNLRPTDIDLSMDWQGRSFVFVELKGGTAPLTMGQKLHLQGLVNGLRAGSKGAVAILANHDTPDTAHDVKCAEARVTQFYDGKAGRWEKPEKPIKLKAFLDQLHKVHSRDGMI